jgi:hypothetical protein
MIATLPCKSSTFSLLSPDDDSNTLLTLDALCAIHQLHTSDPVDCDDLAMAKIDLMISPLQLESITDH